METEEAFDIIEMIAGRFPHYTITETTVAAFMQDVGDLPVAEVTGAVNALARTQADWPRASEIRRHIAAARGLLPPDPATAWSRINGSTWPTGDWPDVDKIIYSLGGQQHLRQHPKDSRWAFTKTYEPAYERAVALILAADDLTPPAAIAEHVAPEPAEPDPDYDYEPEPTPVPNGTHTRHAGSPAAEARRRLAERQAAAR